MSEGATAQLRELSAIEIAELRNSMREAAWSFLTACFRHGEDTPLIKARATAYYAIKAKLREAGVEAML